MFRWLLKKSVWHTACLEFLGVTIDTDKMEFCLPHSKLERYMVAFVLSKSKVTVRNLQPLLDILAFATRIIPISRVFSKRLYRAIAGFKSLRHFMRITSALISDLLV